MQKNFITQNQLEILSDACRKVLGTKDWMTYNCALSWKNDKGRWVHLGYYTPIRTDAYFKKVRGVIYLYFEDGSRRYELNEEVKKLLKVA